MQPGTYSRSFFAQGTSEDGSQTEGASREVIDEDIIRVELAPKLQEVCHAWQVLS